MLVSEIIARVQNGFGDSNQVMIYDNMVIDWINEGMLEIVRETQCISKRDDSYTAAAFIPTGGVGIPDMILLKRVYYAAEALDLLEAEQIDRYGGKITLTGVPTGYYTEGSRLFLYPIPIATDLTPISCFYVPEPAKVNVVTESPGIPFYYHGDLAEWCLAKAHERNENFRASELIMTRFMKNITKRKFESLSRDDTYRTVHPDIMDYDYGYDLI
jgi:hypothetical protein